MMVRPVALLALLLAGCGGPGQPVRPLSPQEEVCASAPDDDPAVKEARAIAAGSQIWQWQHGPELSQLKRDAVSRCLRSRGLAPRGGVERPR